VTDGMAISSFGGNACLKENFTPGFWIGKGIILIHA
jgi:hypothetical protein